MIGYPIWEWGQEQIKALHGTDWDYYGSHRIATDILQTLSRLAGAIRANCAQTWELVTPDDMLRHAYLLDQTELDAFTTRIMTGDLRYRIPPHLPQDCAKTCGIEGFVLRRPDPEDSTSEELSETDALDAIADKPLLTINRNAVMYTADLGYEAFRLWFSSEEQGLALELSTSEDLTVAHAELKANLEGMPEVDRRLARKWVQECGNYWGIANVVTVLPVENDPHIRAVSFKRALPLGKAPNRFEAVHGRVHFLPPSPVGATAVELVIG